MRRYIIDWLGSFSIIEMFVFNELVCKFYINLNKILIGYVLEVDKLILKLIWNGK